MTSTQQATLPTDFSALTLLVERQEGHPVVKKTEWWGAGMVICLQRGADLHMAKLMPLPLTVSCLNKIQIGFTFLVTAHPGRPGKKAIKRVHVSYPSYSQTDNVMHGRGKPGVLLFSYYTAIPLLQRRTSVVRKRCLIRVAFLLELHVTKLKHARYGAMNCYKAKTTF